MYFYYLKKAGIAAIVTIAMLGANCFAGIKMKPTPLPGLQYQKLLHSGKYDSSIPAPESLLGFPVGKQTATPAQIVDSIKAWDQASNKMVLVEYARTHENRPLFYAIISTPENLAKIKSVKEDLARLANPKNLSANDADKIIDRLPAVAWMGYSIHGNESSGSDASLAAIYHLIASQDSDVKNLLSKSIIIIDPSMNPDGRARFTKMLEQARGVAPNVDTQSLLHSGVWPWGRTNHYLFDLNRDFILGVHPETIGRVKAINQWRPQLMIDGHEMGSSDTYLFAPPREPFNKHLTPTIKKWSNIFANDQASAFDQKGWPYYTGEWFEKLYPGYSSYSEFRGSIHILYEQAQVSEDGVRHTNGRILTYSEAVHHQLTSTLTNLKTLVKNSKDIYRDFLADRQKIISDSSKYADISYAIPQGKNTSRWLRFVRLMQLQGFELFVTKSDQAYGDAINQLGETVKADLPKDSLIIRNRQPEARLLSAILEFDAKIDDAVLVKERQNVLRDGSSIMYDTTAWNLTMMHGVEAYTIPRFIDSNIEVYKEADPAPAIVKNNGNFIVYIVDGVDDASVGFAARLLEQGVKVRIIDKDTVLDGRSFPRGSVVVYKYDNKILNDNLDSLVEVTAREVAVSAVAIAEGLGEGDLPDIGGSHFRLLQRPQIAILSRGSVNSYDYGSIWHSIDSNLGIRHSHLNIDDIGSTDLRRYNTLVMPDSSKALDKDQLTVLNKWVEAGGTLIAIDRSIPALVDPKAEFSNVRTLGESLKEIDKYNVSLQREWLAQQDSYPEIQRVWDHNVAAEIAYPWSNSAETESEETLKKQEEWLSKFSPSGAIVAARTDQKHWLTFGSPQMLPVLVANNPVLMSDDKSEAVVRMGVYRKLDRSVWRKISASFKDQPISRKVGWSSLPNEYELKLRMSGLLWPEAGQRIANSAYLTREQKGHGQIILFASQPVFRGSTLATNRLLLNALVYGSGLGTNHVVQP